jgi:hypothetical protein
MTTAVLFLLLAAAGAGGEKGEKKDTGKKPSLELRQRPLFPTSPAEMTFTAELKGGTDSEEFYCPTVEWEWGDDARHGGTTGTKSVEEGDCDPYQPGAEITRRFEKEHRFNEWGTYKVQVTLKKAGKVIARQTRVVNVKAGAGDPTAVREPEDH